MDDKTRKLIEKYDSDFCKIASKDVWEPQDVTMMKDLQKIMYYLEVRDSMNGGKNYGEEYDQGEGMSYGRSGRRGGSSGRSYNNSYGNNSYGYGEGGSGRSYYYDDMSRTSGRRYYDGDKERAVQDLRRMMESSGDPELRTAFQGFIRELEAR